MKNSNDNIVNRNRDLPTRSTVPHPPAPPCGILWTQYEIPVFNLKADRILIRVIYLLRITCYITQLTCIYSKCWK